MLSAFVLLPTLPYLWVIVGAILVPIVWVKTGRTRKAMMAAAGCTTKEEWNAFVNALPTKKQLKAMQQNTGYRPGSALAAVAHADGRPAASPAPQRRTASTTFISPPRPELRYPKYSLLSPKHANIEVVGEAYREKSVIAALGGLTPEVEKTVEDAITFLIHEPENPYGEGHAVMVWMNGHHVGYLASEDAAKYMPYIKRITDAGYLPTTTGRIWGVSRHDWQGNLKHHLYARVALNDADQLTPTNDPPAGDYSFLPWGNAIQVTKEADHLAELTEHLHGPDSYAIATLRETSRTLKNGTVREYVTVYMSGDEIGELTPNMSEKVLPTIRHLHDLGYEAAAWARVRGSALAIEVTLHVAKAHEVPDSWLAEIPVTVPALHRSRTTATSDPSTTGGIPQAPSNDDTPQAAREQKWDF
ncbi:hypothetical protein JD276_15295 [Leucobacter sp. CSA1]|uniref:HIRAN domain-containing protein n=1 Tax=Leucobacter chromiisoli TaxID=2796471 RepID=A0A934UWL5_9MICO|nr:hypothetical protein [Leucobacter chromiisoli]MBK0420393.1 hypothetical protein [Leucobacter chromiisoli]